MRTELFDYELPDHFIAQYPVEPRDTSRLMVLHRSTGLLEHKEFRHLSDYLSAGDLLIANDSRVIPARLFAHKKTGGRVEILLLRKLDPGGVQWQCLLRGRNVRPGAVLEIDTASYLPESADLAVQAQVEDDLGSGLRIIRFSQDITPLLDDLGEIPLPPYITHYAGDRSRYQTVYSKSDGSVAAPTAGLHFTADLLLRLRDLGVLFETVTLHVGLDTFRPVSVEQIEEHNIHTEWAQLSADVAHRINQTSLQGGKIVAVGTTAARTLEWAATAAQGIAPYENDSCPWQRTAAFTGNVDIFVRPGYRFRAVDALLTNFHLPRSSLLMMVSAFVEQEPGNAQKSGREILLNAYEVAKQEGYRFFSFGDAMLIL